MNAIKESNTEVKDPRGGWTSASNAAADELCAGRHNAQKGIADRPSDDSEFGNKVHKALATDVTTDLSDEELKIYEQCVEIRQREVEKFFGDDHPNVKVSKERRFWCQILAKPGDKSPNAARYRHSGQVDFIARLGRRALIVEYKALPGDVPTSPTNKQLRDQVVLAAGEMVIPEIGAVVVQPLVTHSPNVCLYTTESIKRAEAEMFSRVRANNNPEAERTANTVSCKFCLAKEGCSPYQTWVTAMVPKSEVIAATPVEQWTPEMRSHFLTMRPAVEQWLDDCYKKLKAMMKESPTSVPGYKLKPGSNVTTINDPQKLFERFCELGQEWANKENPEMSHIHTLTPIFMQCVTVGNGSLSEVVRKITGLKGKALEKQVEDLRAGIIDSKRNDHSITKDS